MWLGALFPSHDRAKFDYDTFVLQEKPEEKDMIDKQAHPKSTFFILIWIVGFKFSQKYHNQTFLCRGCRDACSFIGIS